jgi:hypothetical protein
VLWDSSKGRNLSVTGPKQVHISNEVSSVHNDITANMLNPSSGTNSILAVSTDHVYIGQIFRFSKVDIDLSSLASADGGVLVVEYWNGSTWSAVTNKVDGTAVGGNTMRQDGKIKFNIPTNWAKNDPPATGTSLYYIRIRTTSTTGTDAVAQLIEPSSGQYFEVAFEGMNLNGPEGPPRPEEILKLDRGQLNAAGGYIQGLDDTLVAPQDLSFTATIDDTVNRTALVEALQCGSPAVVESWPLVGISTKGDSQRPSGLDGTMVYTPQFQDPTKKTVCVQAMWDQASGPIFRNYNEVYFDLGQITLTEAADGVNLNIKGAVYGSVQTNLTHLGYEG